MMTRCTNPNSPAYQHYGGRGITVSPELRTFEGFYAVLGDRPKGMTLERIDVNRGYVPNNVKWASRVEQQRNKRETRLFVKDGRAQTLAAWCAELGLPYDRVRRRIQRGWLPERALSA